MEKRTQRLVAFGLLALVLSGCAAWGGRLVPGSQAELPSEIEIRVKQALSARTGVAVDEMEVVAAQEKEWPDACLGLSEEGEMCAQVITPGWRIKLRAEGETYVFRTDEDAGVIRMEE